MAIYSQKICPELMVVRVVSVTTEKCVVFIHSLSVLATEINVYLGNVYFFRQL